MALMETLLPQVETCLKKRRWPRIPALRTGDYQITPLAQGEYNLNYRAGNGRDTVVVRVNIGTQIERDDQIEYEYKALQLLTPSGVTPVPYFVDGAPDGLEHGLLIMEYLPGAPLDYRRDLDAAAGVFARIHQVEVPDGMNHLIVEDAPLSLIYKECTKLLQQYFTCAAADPDIVAYLKMLLIWADAARHDERWYQEDPWPCIVNTEVNSGNFIVNRARRSIHLVDWEMPRWGDPSQDLAHFCSPLTTRWKTDFVMDEGDRRRLVQQYAARMDDAHLRDTIYDRLRLREPFVRLRGISWSAMGWAAYQDDSFDGLQNPDTWQTLQRYLRLPFIRTVFDPYLNK